MYQSDIFCLVSNQSLIIDTEISKIISLSMIIYFFIFPQIKCSWVQKERALIGSRRPRQGVPFVVDPSARNDNLWNDSF